MGSFLFFKWNFILFIEHNLQKKGDENTYCNVQKNWKGNVNMKEAKTTQKYKRKTKDCYADDDGNIKDR